MWINPSFNHLRCLRTNLKLRRRGVRTVLYGSGEALQRRPHFLQGHRRGPHLRWTWEYLGGQFHSEIDHIIFNRRFYLIDVAVVPNFYTESNRRFLRARFCFSVRGESYENEAAKPPSAAPPRFPCECM
uniref:Uncharacterized protein n=1 Tax=Haemonchus contortus TaxID=6289 RepID=A0A7I4Z3C0_HAECO